MSTATRFKPHTFDDFCFLVRDDQKADLMDGVIYMASPDNTDANDLFMWVGGLMFDFADLRDLGRVFGSRVAFRINDMNAPEPDIAFILRNRMHLIRRGHILGRPDLAMEIVSPESVDRDYVKKRAQYQAAGVPEYWILDELKQKVILLRLTSKGTYREVRPVDGELHSKVLTGFWIRPEWLWQQPRPKKAAVLQMILAKRGRS